MKSEQEISYGLKKNNPIRYTYGLILGSFSLFIIDIFFSLKYGYSLMLHPLKEYFLTILLCYLIVESLLIINKKINVKYNWDQNPFDRFYRQLIIDSTFTISVVIIVRLLYKNITNDLSYVVAKDEISILIFVFLLVFGFVVTELAYFLLNKWRFNLAELERFKKENAEYRFELLQSQLNPHFLFNSLNTVSALVYENQDNAGLFIRKLSDVYRYILDHRDNDLVSLETELSFAESYILLMKLRFEDNLQISVKTDHINGNKYQLAPLSLQLLLENAFKHNVVSKKKPLHIDVSLESEYLIVKNNKQIKTSHEESHQMGLKNLNSRYQFLSDKEIIVENTTEEFIVKLPLIKTQNN